MQSSNKHFKLDYDYIFKFVITGDSSVGKSSLLLRFSDNFFVENWLPTIGVDFKQRSLDIDNKSVKISLWDTAGQERFKTIIRTYYKGIHAVILAFDVTNRESFQNIEKWMEEVKQYSSSVYEKVFMLLLGNKCDLEAERMVCKEEAEDLAEQLGCQYVETSAKNGTGVDKAFKNLASQLIEHVDKLNSSRQSINNKEKKKIFIKKSIDNNDKLNKQYCCSS